MSLSSSVDMLVSLSSSVDWLLLRLEDKVARSPRFTSQSSTARNMFLSVHRERRLSNPASPQHHWNYHFLHFVSHMDSTCGLPHPFSAPLSIHFPKLMRSLYCLKSARTSHSFHTSTQAAFIAHAALFNFTPLGLPRSFFNISTLLPSLNPQL